MALKIAELTMEIYLAGTFDIAIEAMAQSKVPEFSHSRW